MNKSPNPENAALDAYALVLEDPRFHDAMAHDLAAAGGAGTVTVEQLAHALLPSLVFSRVAGAETTPLIPPLDVWVHQVQRGYRELNIPAAKDDSPEGQARVSGYLLSLLALNGGSLDYQTAIVERSVPLGNRLGTFISLGQAAITKVVSNGMSAQDPPRRVIRSTKPVINKVAAAAEKVRIDAATLAAERELDYETGADRIRFLRYLAISCGYSVVEPKPDVYDMMDAAVNEEYDEVAGIKFTKVKARYERIKLGDAVSLVADAIDTAKVDLDRSMSQQILALLSKRLKASSPRAQTHQRFDQQTLEQLHGIFTQLDPGAFAVESPGLDNMQNALQRRVASGQISEQVLDKFWGVFLDPEQRKFF